MLLFRLSSDFTRKFKTAIEIGLPFDKCDNFLLFIVQKRTRFGVPWQKRLASAPVPQTLPSAIAYKAFWWISDSKILFLFSNSLVASATTKPHPSTPGVTTARRVISPTGGPLPPCKQAFKATYFLRSDFCKFRLWSSTRLSLHMLQKLEWITCLQLFFGIYVSHMPVKDGCA